MNRVVLIIVLAINFIIAKAQFKNISQAEVASMLKVVDTSNSISFTSGLRDELLLVNSYLVSEIGDLEQNSNLLTDILDCKKFSIVIASIYKKDGEVRANFNAANRYIYDSQIAGKTTNSNFEILYFNSPTRIKDDDVPIAMIVDSNNNDKKTIQKILESRSNNKISREDLLKLKKESKCVIIVSYHLSNYKK